eukprot:gene11289-7823_t
MPPLVYVTLQNGVTASEFFLLHLFIHLYIYFCITLLLSLKRFLKVLKKQQQQNNVLSVLYTRHNSTLKRYITKNNKKQTNKKHWLFFLSRINIMRRRLSLPKGLIATPYIILTGSSTAHPFGASHHHHHHHHTYTSICFFHSTSDRCEAPDHPSRPAPTSSIRETPHTAEMVFGSPPQRRQSYSSYPAHDRRKNRNNHKNNQRRRERGYHQHEGRHGDRSAVDARRPRDSDVGVNDRERHTVDAAHPQKNEEDDAAGARRRRPGEVEMGEDTRRRGTTGPAEPYRSPTSSPHSENSERSGATTAAHPPFPRGHHRRRPIMAEAAAASPLHGGGGWGWEEAIDPATGETPLEALYRLHQERWLLPTSSLSPHRALFGRDDERDRRWAFPSSAYADGSIAPHLVVGFGHYDYQMRDVYRATLAKALNELVSRSPETTPTPHPDAWNRPELTAQNIKLSASWSGRFDVQRFHRVRKVCGVRISLVEEQSSPLHHKTNETTTRPSESGGEEKKASPPTTDNDDSAVLTAPPLPPPLKAAVAELVRRINAGSDTPLLSIHLLQAAEGIPEEDDDTDGKMKAGGDSGHGLATAAAHHLLRGGSTAEQRGGVPAPGQAVEGMATQLGALHVLLWRLRCLLSRDVLGRHAVVFVVGGGGVDGEKTDTSGCSTEATTQADLLLSSLHAEDTSASRHVTEILVKERWFKVFYNHRYLPKVCSLMGLAVEFAVRLMAPAVLERKPEVTSTNTTTTPLPFPSNTEETSDVCAGAETIPEFLHTFLQELAAAAAAAAEVPKEGKTRMEPQHQEEEDETVNDALYDAEDRRYRSIFLSVATKLLREGGGPPASTAAASSSPTRSVPPCVVVDAWLGLVRLALLLSARGSSSSSSSPAASAGDHRVLTTRVLRDLAMDTAPLTTASAAAAASAGCPHSVERESGRRWVHVGTTTAVKRGRGVAAGVGLPFPFFFLHGAYGGDREAIQFLSSRTRPDVLDAVLRHPSHVSVKHRARGRGGGQRRPQQSRPAQKDEWQSMRHDDGKIDVYETRPISRLLFHPAGTPLLALLLRATGLNPSPFFCLFAPLPHFFLSFSFFFTAADAGGVGGQGDEAHNLRLTGIGALPPLDRGVVVVVFHISGVGERKQHAPLWQLALLMIFRFFPFGGLPKRSTRPGGKGSKKLHLALLFRFTRRKFVLYGTCEVLCISLNLPFLLYIKHSTKYLTNLSSSPFCLCRQGYPAFYFCSIKENETKLQNFRSMYVFQYPYFNSPAVHDHQSAKLQ